MMILDNFLKNNFIKKNKSFFRLERFKNVKNSHFDVIILNFYFKIIFELKQKSSSCIFSFFIYIFLQKMNFLLLK